MFKRTAKTALSSLNITGVFRHFNKSGVRILMYHRFTADARGLEQQCDHIRRFYQPVALREVAESLRTGRPLPPNAVAITVDDGYRDFLTSAHPVFRAFGIPSTVFLVSDFLDGRLWFWWDTLRFALEHTRHRSLDFDTSDAVSHSFSLGTSAERDAALETIGALLITVEDAERHRLIAALVGHLDVAMPTHPPANCAPLTWDEVRQLAKDNVEFGAHTKTHPILSRIRDRQTLHDEIATPKARIESEIGESVIHFCYPNGRREDFTDEAVKIIAECKFRTAVTTERGINFAGAPPLLLRRLGCEPDLPAPYFHELLAGVRRV